MKHSRSMRYCLSAVSVALVGAAAPISVAPTAFAATAPVVSSASSADDDLGAVQVSVSAEAGVTEIVAHVVSFVTGQELTSVSDFELVSGTAQNGVWVTRDPVQLDALGGYRLDVEVTDAAGQHVTKPFAGTLAYVVQTAFSPIMVDRTSVDYAHRTVQVSGTLTGRWPGTREVRPIADAPVLVETDFGFPPTSVTTDTDGRFTGGVTVDEPEGVSALFVADSPFIGFQRANSDSVQIGVEPSATRLTMKASSVEVDAGGSVTVSGRLVWKSPDGWEPLPDRRVGVLFCRAVESCPSGPEVATTDADGRYELSVTPFETGFYRAGFVELTDSFQPDPFVAQAEATADVTVWQRESFADFSAERDESGLVIIRGHLAFENFTPAVIPVEIQFRPQNTATWRTVTTVDATQLDVFGYNFAASVDVDNRGYWRAFYPGVASLFRPLASPVILVR